MRVIGLLAAALLTATPAFASFDGVLTFARAGDTAAVLKLLAAGDDPNAPEYHTSYTPLQFAAQHGDVAMVKALLDAGAETEYRDHNDDRAMLWAVYEGHTEVVKLLLDAGSPPQSELDPYGMTPTMRASERGHAEILRLLIAAGADVNRRDQTGSTALHYAARLDDPRPVEMLLAAGANPNVFEEIFLETPLHEAARWSDGATVAPLLAASAALDARDDEGKTPLFDAAEIGNVGVATALIAAYAEPDAKALNGDTPILAAMGFFDERRVAQTQVALQLAEVTTDLDRAFAAALWRDFPTVALRLLERGASANGIDEMGRPALAGAARVPGLTFFQLLLLRGADVEAHGPAALIEAASRGRLDIARRLIDLGVPVDGRDPRGATPLLHAAREGQVEAVRYLLAQGADPASADDFAGGAEAYMEILPSFFEYRIETRSASRAWRPTDELEIDLAGLRARHAEIRELLGLDPIPPAP